MQSAILQPIVALAAWTMVMWLWMYATRIPAMKRAAIDGAKMIGSTPGSLRADLVAKGEVRASWIADNYNHLHEAPTVFYAVAIVLAMIGQGDGVNAMIAWAYGGLRVLHSLVQIIGNRVAVRFVIFTLSTLALMALTLHASISVFSSHAGDQGELTCAAANGDC
jgi:hypothetical protein